MVPFGAPVMLSEKELFCQNQHPQATTWAWLLRITWKSIWAEKLSSLQPHNDRGNLLLLAAVTASVFCTCLARGSLHRSYSGGASELEFVLLSPLDKRWCWQWCPRSRFVASTIRATTINSSSLGFLILRQFGVACYQHIYMLFSCTVFSILNLQGEAIHVQNTQGYTEGKVEGQHWPTSRTKPSAKASFLQMFDKHMQHLFPVQFSQSVGRKLFHCIRYFQPKDHPCLCSPLSVFLPCALLFCPIFTAVSLIIAQRCMSLVHHSLGGLLWLEQDSPEGLTEKLRDFPTHDD